MTLSHVLKSIWFVVSVFMTYIAFHVLFADPIVPVLFALGMMVYFGGVALFIGQDFYRKFKSGRA